MGQLTSKRNRLDPGIAHAQSSTSDGGPPTYASQHFDGSNQSQHPNLRIHRMSIISDNSRFVLFAYRVNFQLSDQIFRSISPI